MNGTHPRILQGVAYTAQWQPLGSDGETATADPGTVTVGVTRSDGTTVIAAGTATTGATTAPRVAPAVTAAQTALLDVLTYTWKVGATTIATTYVDVVGAFSFKIAELRTAERELADPTAVTSASLLTIRDEVESSFESWTNLSMVPKLTVVDVRGVSGVSGCRLPTGVFYIRAVRWVRLWTSDTAYTELSAADCAAIAPAASGVLERTSGWYGTRIQVGVEHGWDAPPADGKRMALLYARICALRSVKGISGSAQSYTTPEGQIVSYDPNVEPTNYKVINEFLRRQGIDHRLPGLA